MFDEYEDPERRHETVRTLESTSQVTRLGAGALHEIGASARQQGITKALLVTDAHLGHSEAAHVIERRLADHGIGMELCVCVTPTPLVHDVDEAVERLGKAGCDGVVSLGGGSAHDVGKGVALLGRNGGTIHEYAHEQKTADATLPHIAVSTTAGTGAEMSSYAFFVEEHGHEHTILWHDILVPEVAIIDPVTHVSMPQHVTAATGINALSDAIEAYVSRSHTDASDEAALEAIRLIGENLPTAYHDGHDLEARTRMAEAAYKAGTAFNAAGLGIVDSISLVVSSLFNIGHSTANAIVLPHVMAYDAFSVEGRMGDIAKALGKDPGTGRQAMAQAAVEAVEDLKQEVGLTENLADRGMTWDDLYLCAHAILRHPFIKRNPRDLDEEGLTKILLDSMETRRIVVEAPPAS